LLHKGVGAKRLQLRVFTIDVGGYAPLERHAYEHEVLILRGKVIIKSGEQEIIAKQGSVIFISSNEEHQFKNASNTPLEFLCTKETIE
jgi:quercetin dioxygenase-like cupin family protein